MLARLTRSLPAAGHLYEPKWDGFRCIAERVGARVELWSRHGRPFTRYFPELVTALRELDGDWLLDGELLVSKDGHWDFPALMARLHPAVSRVEQLAAETPAMFFVFDLLRLADRALLREPLTERRRLLEGVLAEPPSSVRLTPQTDDAALGERWLSGWRGGGIDGVMAKPADGTYRPGERAVLKVKLEKTADCVLAGFRGTTDPQRAITSLLLGLYDAENQLQHVGVASSFGRARGRELLATLEPLIAPLEGHPWEHGFLLEGGALGRLKGSAGRWAPGMPRDWIPVRPDLVCEVAFDQVDLGRFRHPARLRRIRSDRDPRSCTFDQLAEAPYADETSATGHTER
jgi:ATP-dependent DNA ligase